MSDTQNFAEMSDDDFMKLPMDAGFTAPVEEEAQSEEHIEDAPEEFESDEDTPDDSTDDETTQEDDAESDPDDVEDEGETDAPPADNEGLEAILGTVGGVEIKSVDEARRLMQMGIDAHKSQKGMTEFRKTQKLLETHKISQADLNMLIDIKLGKAKAVTALAKSAGIDMDAHQYEEEGEYLAGDYSYSDDEIQFEDTIKRMQATPTFDKTMQVVRQEWDDKSRSDIVSNPQLLENLNTHMGNGVFEKVMGEVQRARIFGGLEGMSDLDAYNKVGQVMAQRGEFSDMATPAKQVSSAPKKSGDSNLADKRRKASPSKGSQKRSAPVTTGDQFIGMSDAEFIEKYMKG